MTEIEFIFEGTFIIIQCKSEEKFEEIIKRFIIKAGKKKDELIFIYGGGFIDENLTFNEQANEMDKSRNKMSIIVSKNNEKNLDEQSSFKKSNYLICPKCKESARILINNYKIELYNCKKGHKTNDILINDFDKTQNLEESEKICLNCNKANKNDSFNNKFFICFECKKNLCPLCKSIHDKTHNIIDYDEKYFICDLHYESYNSYCTDCNTDICIICENQHNGHKILSYGKIFPDIKKIKEKVNDFISKKEAFKNDIKNIINKLNILMSTMDKYFEINEDIIKCYGNKKRNYSLLQNINDMDRFNDNVMRDLNKIINENNICHKIENIIDIYNKMNQKDYKNNIKLSEIENNNDNKQQKNNINTKDKIEITDGIFTINRNVGFFDLKNGKKLKSFNVAEWNLTPPFCLINKDIFVFYDRFCLITILLSNHSKEEFYMNDVDFRDSVESIISLNEKKFIVTLYNRIKLFELKGVKNIININTINLNCDIIKKYPKSRLLIKEKKNESSDSSIINLFY